MQETRITIDSEIGALNAVMIHRPGREIENMTPATASEVLYDDILNRQLAVRQHDQLTGVLQRVAKVYEFEDLLREARSTGRRMSTPRAFINEVLDPSCSAARRCARTAWRNFSAHCATRYRRFRMRSLPATP